MRRRKGGESKMKVKISETVERDERWRRGGEEEEEQKTCRENNQREYMWYGMRRRKRGENKTNSCERKEGRREEREDK